MKKNKKLIETIIILFVIIIFIIMGIIIYQRYIEKQETNQDAPIINDYYNSEFLFNNGYIKIADTIENLKQEDNIYMYLDKENTLNIKTVEKSNINNKQIKGLPQGKLKVYYNYLKDDCYEIAALKEKELYYINVCLKDTKEAYFEKISTTVKEIYVPEVTKKFNITETKNITSNFIIDTEINELKYISIEDNIIGLYNNIKDKTPYFDYICIYQDEICKNTMYYINFEKELVPNYDIENPVKTNENKKLIVQDLFGTLESNNKNNLDINNLIYKDFLEKINFSFKLYVLDINNDLYKIDMTNETLKNKEISNITKVSNDKVKTITYETNETPEITGILITYADGTIEKITSGENKTIITSTLYEKNSNKNLLPNK